MADSRPFRASLYYEVWSQAGIKTGLTGHTNDIFIVPFDNIVDYLLTYMMSRIISFANIRQVQTRSYL